uniref:Amino acid transporter n=1 Tax=Cacopsylla melanoneura TaxID=428564 RepID=A0A8D8QCT6_9HEMI
MIITKDRAGSGGPLATALQWIKNNLFLICTLAGVCLGVILGLILRNVSVSQDAILLIQYPGELYMRALKLLILPFVISCLIVGTATLDIKRNGKIAVRTLIYFFVTSVINVILGITLALLIHPGNPEVKFNAGKAPNIKQINILDGFLDMGRNLLPDNIFQASFQQAATEYTKDPVSETVKRSLKNRDGTNTLGLIFFCLIFGSVLGTLNSPKKQVVIDFFQIVYETLLQILLGTIWFTPIGVGSIICGKIISVSNLGMALEQLSLFIVCTVGGFLIYQLIICQLIYFFILKKNPFEYYAKFTPAILTAFATASKSASLPITFRVMDDIAKKSQRISRFILPIGTINMDGSALYLPCAVIFIAQINNIYLGFGEIVTIGLACLFASFSSAAIPSAAIVLVVMLCSTINAPVEDVTLLFAVDWFVDRFRTINNLLGDCYTVAVVEHLSQKELRENLEELSQTQEDNNDVSKAIEIETQFSNKLDSVEVSMTETEKTPQNGSVIS